MTAAYTWVGYAAGTLTTVAFLPQVLHVWKTKRADDLHMGTLVSFMAGVTLWLAYGIATRQMPVIVANAVTLILQCAILVLKLRYSGGRAKPVVQTSRSEGGTLMKNENPHPGISIHKIPVGAGIAGLIFTVGSLAIFLVGLPVLWYFLAGAVALGLGVAVLLHLRES